MNYIIFFIELLNTTLVNHFNMGYNGVDYGKTTLAYQDEDEYNNDSYESTFSDEESIFEKEIIKTNNKIILTSNSSSSLASQNKRSIINTNINIPIMDPIIRQKKR